MAHRIRETADPETGRTTRTVTIGRGPLTAQEAAVARAHVAHTIASSSFDAVVAPVETQLRRLAEAKTIEPDDAVILSEIDRARRLIQIGRASEAAAVGVRIGKLYTEAAALRDWPIVKHGRDRRRAQKAGADKRGQKTSTHAARNDDAIRKYWRQWLDSDDLQELHRSPVAYVRAKKIKGLSKTRTIERRLKAIDPDWRRKSRQ